MKSQKGQSLISIIGYLFVILVILFLLTFLYGQWDDKKNKDTLKDFESYYDFKKQPLELVGNVTTTSSGSFGYYTHTIEGIFKNVSGRKLSYAQVSFVLYDSDGNNIGSAFDNVNYIDVNGTWKFSATYFGQEQNIKYNPVPEITAW